MNLKKNLGVAAAFLLALLAASAPAQVTSVYLPDGDASTGVSANMIPFSSAFGSPTGSWSHLTVIPAAMLAAQGVQAGDRLLDIQFASCGTGTVTMSNVQVIVGHLVSPLPTFSLLNGFADQALVYDSSVSGALSFPCTANSWASLRIGGGGLTWNGASDVGVYSTHSGLAISSTTGWQGSFWRASALMRHYVNAYQATMALTSALSGLKIGLVFANPISMGASLDGYGQATAGSTGMPGFVGTEMPSLGNPWFGLGVTNAAPGAVAVLVASSGAANVPIGVGADARLLVDLSPAAATFLVAVPVSASGNAFVPAPVPNYAPGLAGFTVFCQWAIVGDPAAPMTLFGLPLAFSAGLAVTIGV